MSSWKARLLMLLATMAMLIAVSVPAMADDLDGDGIDDDCIGVGGGSEEGCIGVYLGDDDDCDFEDFDGDGNDDDDSDLDGIDDDCDFDDEEDEEDEIDEVCFVYENGDVDCENV